MLEASCEILSSTELPSLICGVILRMLPTSSRWMVWNGLTTPPVPLTPWFVYWPVTNGTSCAILISASSLSSVTIEGVAMMFVLPMPPTARITAAQLVPLVDDLAEAHRQAARQAGDGCRDSARPG